MPEYSPIPVDAARRIAEAHDKSFVVILAYDEAHLKTHTTTYGVEAFYKEQAAAIGELCTKMIGSDLSRKVQYEDFHRDYQPALYREALEILKIIRTRHEAPMERIDRLLEASRTIGGRQA